MHPLALAFYIGLCMLVAILGRNTRAGYWGTAILSFFATPLLTFLFLVLLVRPVGAVAGGRQR